MDNLTSIWGALDMRRKLIVGAATLAVFVAVIFLARGTASRDLALLYSGLESSAAGDVVTALEQQGATYEVRGTSIFVERTQRDVLRMTLAGAGLPANTSQGYELLDTLSGFGTTSQMFDAAYWRAKEGELARTILANPQVRAARVHISVPSRRPFASNQTATAAVTVTTGNGSLNTTQARALRFLVASAVSGLAPKNVSVIDDTGGLIAGNEEGSEKADTLTAELRARAERLLEARVGLGNAVVEVSLETITESESIVERFIDPDSRVAISTEVEERTNSANNAGGNSVTVASNLPEGDAGNTESSSTDESAENRTLTNFEVSETQREVVRVPGGVRRLSVAVLVNDSQIVGADGTVTQTPRTDEELASLKELVASAVGLDEARGDVITLKSMPFQPLPDTGTVASDTPGLPIDIMALAKTSVFALVAIVLALFVVRPILTTRQAPALTTLPEPAALTGTIEDNAQTSALSATEVEASPDAVERLRQMIEERQTETLQVLQDWVDEPDRKETV